MRKLLIIPVTIGLLVTVEVLVRHTAEFSVEAQAKTSLTAGVGTPVLDGTESPGEWTSDAITTTRGVTIKAMMDAENFYILASWPDSAKSVDQDHWTWDGQQWAASEDEDRLAFIWEMVDEQGNSLNGDDGPTCATMCHLGVGMATRFGRVDVWHGKATRFLPIGFTDDKYWDTCEDCSDVGRHGDSGSGSGDRNRNEAQTGPVYGPANFTFLVEDDATLASHTASGSQLGTAAVKVLLDGSEQFAMGDTAAGRILSNPTGNRASVKTVGNWDNGVWTLEFSRKIAGEVGNDGQPEDFTVVPGGSVRFTTEIFDNLADHEAHSFSQAGNSSNADFTVFTLNFPDPTTLYFAQFADGNGIFSQITLFNLNQERDAATTILLNDDEGDPLTVDLNGQEVPGELEVTIPAGSLRRYATDGLGDTVIGSVTVESDESLAGVILFGGTTGLAGVGSSVALDDSGFTAPMEVGAGTNTGVALMNLEGEEVTLNFQLCDEDGGVLATAQMALPAMGHRALFVTEVEWDTVVDFSDFDGLLKMTATGSTSATVIQTRPSQLATMPVAAN
ncbi:MAG TPA: ethylbenzene dehydrogenase-related protein [Acidobacteriota bacterium]|nr:ethylbenzene dehydrogenase-related protein [Acidobacteriota bacterium]